MAGSTDVKVAWPNSVLVLKSWSRHSTQEPPMLSSVHSGAPGLGSCLVPALPPCGRGPWCGPEVAVWAQVPHHVGSLWALGPEQQSHMLAGRCLKAHFAFRVVKQARAQWAARVEAEGF